MEWLIVGLLGVLVLRHIGSTLAPSTAAPRPRSPVGSPTARTTTSVTPPRLPLGAGGPAPSTYTPSDLILTSEAEAQASAAFLAAVGYPPSAIDLQAMRVAFPSKVYNGKVSQADVTAFLRARFGLSTVSRTMPTETRTVVSTTSDGLPSVVRVTTPAMPDVVGVAIYDYAPPPPLPGSSSSKGPSDFISIAAAQDQARATYQAYFGRSISEADLATLGSVANLTVYNGQVRQADVSAFLNSPAALAAVTH